MYGDDEKHNNVLNITLKQSIKLIKVTRKAERTANTAFYNVSM